ncbi:MAG: hypothetical protein LBT40_17070 [Deltaproteobacteria bacterium]|jgi:predicted nucleotidyltransferase|nr:hypothetical protein [Deltaproteobacteria bacterium]
MNRYRIIPLAAILVSLAAALPASGQDGWEIFDSAEITPPYDGPAFTIRFPPGFKRDPPSEHIVNGGWYQVQSFADEDPDIGVVAILMIHRYDWTPDRRPPTEQGALAKYWDGMGRWLAAQARGIFTRSVMSGSGGDQVVDMFYSRAVEDNVVLGDLRAVLKGDGFMLVDCSFAAHGKFAAGWGEDSPRSPVADASCMKSLRTLRFRG